MTLPENTQTYKGEFYLMDRPEIRYNGILTVNIKGNALLELFGSFQTASPAVDKSTYTIWGRTLDGDTLSLLSCSRKERKTRFGVSDTDTWHVPFIVLGAQVTDLQQAYFAEIKFEIDGFREWVGKNGGETSFNFDYTTLGYAYQEPAAIEFRINDELSGYYLLKMNFGSALNIKARPNKKPGCHLNRLKKTV